MESNSFCNHISDLRGGPICLITSIITDRIGPLDVLLPINHSYNKICDILIRLFWKLKYNKFREFYAQQWKKSYLGVRAMARTVQLLRHHAHCSVTLSFDSQSDLRICYSYD